MMIGFCFAQQAGDAGPQGGHMKQKQGWGPGKKMMKERQEMLAKLGLSEVQKKQIAELDKDTAAKAKEIRSKTTQSATDTTRQQMRKLMQDHRAAMEKILTPAQNKQLREMMLAKRKEMREKNQQQPGGGQIKG
ncbi:MAG: motif family protein [Fimbriimonadaceae bacterium]|nr:motif family protein [Fimbriimonadaceae bacterium]